MDTGGSASTDLDTNGISTFDGIQTASRTGGASSGAEEDAKAASVQWWRAPANHDVFINQFPEGQENDPSSADQGGVSHSGYYGNSWEDPATTGSWTYSGSWDALPAVATVPTTEDPDSSFYVRVQRVENSIIQIRKLQGPAIHVWVCF